MQKRKRPKNLVFMTAFEVSGSQHAAHSVQLKPDDPVKLKAIVDNPHDSFAIEVHARDQLIGWYPRVQEGPNYDSRTAGSVQRLLHHLLRGEVDIYGEIVQSNRATTGVALYLVTSS